MSTMKERVPCPKCGRQPVAKKGKTYWSASCAELHHPYQMIATPMKTKTAALNAWDEQMAKEAA